MCPRHANSSCKLEVVVIQNEDPKCVVDSDRAALVQLFDTWKYKIVSLAAAAYKAGRRGISLFRLASLGPGTEELRNRKRAEPRVLGD